MGCNGRELKKRSLVLLYFGGGSIPRSHLAAPYSCYGAYDIGEASVRLGGSIAAKPVEYQTTLGCAALDGSAAGARRRRLALEGGHRKVRCYIREHHAHPFGAFA